MPRSDAEREIQTYLLQRLRALGGWWTNTQGSVHTHRGTPDILGVYNGLFYGIEVKKESGRVSEIQKYVLAEITNSGGKALVVRGRDQATALVKRLSKGEIQ